MSKYYIAYGSNLCVDQMRIRAPKAKIIGTGMLKDWQLLFRGCATIRQNRGFETPVVVWEISGRDEKKLDNCEGFPFMYGKQDLTLPVTALNGRDLGDLTGMAYIMTPNAEKNHSQAPVPFCEYFNVIEHGYKTFGFDKKILETSLEESVKFWSYNR